MGFVVAALGPLVAEPPLDVLDAAIPLSVRDGIEEFVGQIDGAAFAAHEFVLDSSLDS